MINYIYIIKNLLAQVWYFPLLILITLAIYFIVGNSPKALDSTSASKNNNLLPWLAALGTFIILSFPFWFLGNNAPHSGPDDADMTIQTYLSASRQGDSINWTNSMLGGIDRWLLPNCHPLSLGRIYALFLAPYQLFLLIIGINVISVFIFSWKIQIEFLGMRRWMACIGSLAAVLSEGYWTGIYPNAHVSNGHGFAVIVVGIYWLTRFHESSKFWLVSLLVGLALSLGSWIPFHNLPPLLITITIWGLAFWGRGAWLKVLQANVLIILIFSLVLFPQFLAMKLLYATTGRSGIFRPTVDLTGFYLKQEIIVLGVMGILGIFLKIYQQKIVKQVLVMFLGFSAVPAIAYIVEHLKVVPAFRWELLYAGNEAWLWLAVVFFMDKIQLAIERSWRFAGTFLALLIFSLWWTLFIFTWMGSLWFDLDSSYPSGTWAALTETSLSSMVKEIDPGPMRVVGIDDTNDMHFWGQYQGLESITGYTPFIDSRKLYFWWYCAMMPSLHGNVSSTGYETIPIPIKDAHEHLNFPVPLPALINPDALKLSNVDWIISHHPLYPMPDLQPFLEQPGQPEACPERVFVPWRINFKETQHYWQYIGCLVKDYGYQRPLYLYHLQGSLPRAYLAAHVVPWSVGQIPLLSQQQLAVAVLGAAFVDPKEWKQEQDRPSPVAVNIDTYQSDYMHLSIATGQDALLVISSTLNQYWRVLLDDKPVHIFDVNGFQTGLWVHPENKEAEFIYCPPWRPQLHPYCSKH